MTWQLFQQVKAVFWHLSGIDLNVKYCLYIIFGWGLERYLCLTLMPLGGPFWHSSGVGFFSYHIWNYCWCLLRHRTGNILTCRRLQPELLLNIHESQITRCLFFNFFHNRQYQKGLQKYERSAVKVTEGRSGGKTPYYYMDRKEPKEGGLHKSDLKVTVDFHVLLFGHSTLSYRGLFIGTGVFKASCCNFDGL